MSIFVQKGDLTQIVCDAIVNPANSYGFMGGGVAGAIRRAGGSIIEKEAISKAPIPVGKAAVTTGGNLPCRYVVHAPTMEKPAMRINVENVRMATRAAFEIGVKHGIKTIAIPGMGTGVGGVPTKQAAEVMVKIAMEFENKFERIILIGRNDELFDAFKEYLEKK